MTRVLTRSDIASLATPRDYLVAMEAAFLALAAGRAPPAQVGHVAGIDGGFHIKSARLDSPSPVVAIKINGNFPDNPSRYGLPTIQGCLMLADATDGRVLALMDSSEITARRTAAASALAASRLARRDSTVLAFAGCGVQASHHLDALLALDGFAFTALRLFDPDRDRMLELVQRGEAAGLRVSLRNSAAEAAQDADIVVTMTPSTQPVINVGDVRPGTFIAAVGADSPTKSEIAPALMARARVVPDVLAQALVMGDLRRAIAEGTMSAADIHGELADVVSAAVPGRQSDDEIFVFDSTGTAIEDVAAAAMLYAAAVSRGLGISVAFHA